jgi:hypothetical protein
VLQSGEMLFEDPCEQRVDVGHGPIIRYYVVSVNNIMRQT